MNDSIHKFATRQIFFRCFGLLVLFASLIFQTVYAEGSKDLIRNGGNRAYLEHRTGTSGDYITAGIPRVTVIRVYANKDEVVALGSSANGIGSGAINVRGPSGYTFNCPTPGTDNTGKILNRAQEVAGPNYPLGANTSGYRPCTFTVPSDGIYEVDFTQPATANNTNPPPLAVSAEWTVQDSQDQTQSQLPDDNWVTAWDVTVFDGGVAQSGRVFARYYALNLGGGNQRVNLDVYVQTIDGYRYELEQDIEPFGFVFFTNRKGFRDAEGKALYRSIQLTDNDELQAGQDFHAPDDPDDIPSNEITHKIFLNEPDPSMPATAARPGTPASTWLYRPDPKAPPIPQNFTFTGRDGTENQAGTGLGGSFFFTNPRESADDVPNAYNITLEFGDGLPKRVLAGTAVPGTTTEAFWDGKDGNGDDVPAGSGDFTATVRLFAGEVHFPLLDVEDAPTGVTITRLNTPAGSSTTGIADPGRIYFDDSIFTDGQRELDGVVTPPAAHSFTGDFGNHRGIDTWVYYPTAEPKQASIEIREADLSITKTHSPASIVVGGPVSYTLTVTNAEDSLVDAVNAAVTDTFPPSLTDISWTCEITTEGAQAGEPLAASSCGASSGVGDIDTTVNLKRGATATFTITATVEEATTGAVTNTAEVSRGEDASDPDLDNNEASTSFNVYSVSPAAGGIVINELLFDQSGTTSAANNDEFIELYNSSSDPVDLSGWRLVDANLIENDADGRNGNINGNADNAAIPYTFPAVQLAPGEYAVIWVGERTVSRDVSPAAFQAWLGRSARLSNEGDDMWLYDAEGRIVDYVAYGSNTTDKQPINTPPPASLKLWDAEPSSYVSLRNTNKGQSISLTPNGVDSNTSACWEPTTSGDADGRCGSYVPTRDSDAREVGTVALVTSVAQNNNVFSKIVSGTLFYDDGLSGGVANNALQEVGEHGVSSVIITATDDANSANTVTTVTDGAGNYTLIIPDTFGNDITVSHSQQPATGYNDGSSVIKQADSYGDADASSVTFSLTDSATYNFGVARPSSLRPDGSGQVAPGSTVSYTHLYAPGTLGEVELNVSGTYTYQVFRDANCDGIIQTNEQVDVLPGGFTVDSTWPRAEDGSLAPCALELRVFVPQGESSGRIDLATLSASLVYNNNPDDVTDVQTVTDVTTVTAGGQLELTKRVRNVDQGTAFTTLGAGKPGEVLEYCIAYQNLGTQPLTQTLFSDPIPFFTSFATGVYGGAGQDGDIEWTHDGAVTPLSAAADSDAGKLDGGVVYVTIGEVGAGEAGKVCYRVSIK